MSKKHFQFNKTNIKSGIKSSNRDAIQERARKLVEEKFKKNKVININLKNKKAPTNPNATFVPYGDGKIPKPANGDAKKGKTMKMVQIIDADGKTRAIPESELENELKNLSGDRFTSAMRRSGLSYETEILHSREENEKQEAIIHSAGVYTSPRNTITKKSYDIPQIQRLFGSAWEEVSDEFENVYDESQLLRFHDMLRVDGDINKALLKSNRFVTGVDYPRLMLDINCTTPSNESESYELRKVQNNFVYWSIKNELERIDRNVNSYGALHSQLYQTRGYQRGALLIERDENGVPLALKPLTALRLGRVFFHADTWRFMGVECMDFRKPNNIVLAEDLIYMVNRDYAQSMVSMLYGYSDLEFVIHLVELNLIINSIVLKEINRTHWAPYVFIQLLETEDEDTAADFMSKAKRGLSMVSLLPFKVDAIPPSHSGDFVVNQRKANSVEIISDMGVPVDLISAGGDQAHANLSTRLQSYNQTDVKFYRLLIRQVWESQWYGRNVMAIIKRRLQRLKSKQSKIQASQLEQPALSPDDELVTQSVTSPGEITIKEARNRISMEENDSIIEYEREIWETNRKLQISKIKSLVEAEIAANNVSLEDSDKTEIFDELGGEYLKKDSEEVVIPTNDEYFGDEKEESDTEPFDLASELGLDVISPSDEKFEIEQLERLAQYTDHSRLPFKIKMLFSNVSFDTDIETALYTIGLFQAEIITKEKALEKTGNEDIIQQVKEETQIKLFIAKALAPAIQKSMEEQQARDEDLVKQGLMSAPKIQPGGQQQKAQQQAGQKGINPKKSQLDLRNRTNVATRLGKRGGLQNRSGV